MAFCILRCEKLKTFGDIAGSGAHNFREQETKNADPKRTHLNKTVGAQNKTELVDAMKARLSTVKKIRKNPVLGLEYYFGASPEWFQTATPKQREAMFDDAEKWLRIRHGSENVVALTRHYDETTPHMAAYVVPIDSKGKLNASHWMDGIPKLQALQTDYAEKVGKKYGLQRGIEGSTAKHGTIKEFYDTVNAPIPQPKTVVPKVPEATFSEKLTESMGLDTDRSIAAEAAEVAKKKRDAEIAAQNKATQNKAKLYDLVMRENKDQSAALAKLRETSVQLRKIDLTTVLERLGYERDTADKNNWKTHLGRIAINNKPNEPGTKFFNHDMNVGGGGAIDLVMHLEQTDYKGAVKILADEFGTGVVLSQAVVTLKAEIEAAAAAPAPPYVPPVEVPEHWPSVRDYLTNVRKISSLIVDRLKEKGKIYADQIKNAVFVFSGNSGVELRGTVGGEKNGFHGIRGKKTGFILRNGDPAIKKVAFVEASIDAISLYELGKFKGKIIATGGNAASLAKELADKHRADGYEVFSAHDNDEAGDSQALNLGQAGRIRPVLHDWNADLKASKAPKIDPPPVQVARERRDEQQSEYARMRG